MLTTVSIKPLQASLFSSWMGWAFGSENNYVEPPSKNELLYFSRKAPAPAEDGGAVAVDLDEAALGGYNIVENLQIVGNQGLTGLVDELGAQAEKLYSAPTQWIRDQVSSTGAVDAGISFAVSGVVLPLSILAIKAGVDGTVEAIDKHVEFNAQRAQIKKNLQPLKDLKELGDVSLAVAYARKIEKQSLAAINSAIDHNFCEVGIGISCSLSGASIFIKTVPETVLQAVTWATIKATAGLTMATTVIGTLSTVFLAPLAAICAVGLGGFFLHRSRMVSKELEEDQSIIKYVKEKSLQSNLKNIDEGIEAKPVYEKFIEHKFASRQNFADRFKRWNAGFLTGACGIALSALPKAALGIAAMAGAVSLMATPPGLTVLLGVLLLLGIVGGVTMGACCWQFLMLNDKDKRHQAYRSQESQFLGRRFDALHIARTTTSGQGDPDAHGSVRASLYNFVSQRDQIRQGFLRVRANEMSKFHKWEQRATDKLKDDELVNRDKQRYKNADASWSMICTYFAHLFTNLFNGGTHAAAVDEARKVYALKTEDLTEYALTRWLEGDNEFGEIQCEAREIEQRDLFIRILNEQKEFLVEKRKAYEGFVPLFSNNEVLEPAVQKTFADAKEEVRQDSVRLQKIDDLLKRCSANNSTEALNHLKREFLQLQGLSLDDLPHQEATTEINHRLAQYLITDLSEELTITRGILFDMHRQSFHLQHRLLRYNEKHAGITISAH